MSPHEFVRFFAAGVLLASAPLAQSRLVYRSPSSGFQVGQVLLSADGRHAALAGGVGGSFSNLWLARLDGLEAPRLIAPAAGTHLMAQGGWLLYLEKLPDSMYLLKRLALDGVDAPVVLFPERLSSGLTLGPGDTHVAFVDPIARRVHCAAVDGSTPPVMVSGSLLALSSSPPRFSVDGARLLLLAEGPGGAYELHSAPLDASSEPVAMFRGAAGESINFARGVATPSGRFVFYVRPSMGPARVLSVPIDGSAAALELTAAIGEYQPDGYQLQVSPDGAWAVFAASRLLGPSSDRYWQKDLLLVPTDGSAAPRRLNEQLPRYGNVADAVWGASFTPDSQRFVYAADQAQDDRVELYSVTLDVGSVPQRLSPSLPAGGDVDADFLLTADEPCRVVFRADVAQDELDELWSVPADGSAPARRLNTPFPPGGLRDVFEFQLDHERRTVLYVANEDGPFGVELHAVPSDGRHPDERLSSIQSVDNPFLSIRGVSSRAGSTVFLRAQARFLALLDLYAHTAPHAARR